MPRTVSPALEKRLNAQVTATGYLLRFEMNSVEAMAATRAPASMLQVCDLGELRNATLGDFAAADFSVANAGENQVTLTIANLDGAAGSLVLNADPLAALKVTLWQVERKAPDEAVQLGVYLPTSADVGLDVVRITMHGKFTRFRFAPNRRINAANGFLHALRPGEIFLWGAQRVFIRGKD